MLNPIDRKHAPFFVYIIVYNNPVSGEILNPVGAFSELPNDV